jgi:hypothetical protein
MCAALLALLAVGTASASAANVYVSKSAPTVVGGKSCAQPDYSSIQTAIENAAGSTVAVCPGSYTEQLTISGAAKVTAIDGAGSATVTMPASPAFATDSCSLQINGQQRNEITICTPETVTLTGLNVEAEIPLSGCGGGLQAIFVAGGGTLKATSLAIDGATSSIVAERGCQWGIALLVGSIEPTQVGHAVLNKVAVSNYAKNGPTDLGVGSTLKLISSTVTGEGASPYVAQNGVQISFGAGGSVSSSTISGNECSLPVSCSSTNLENQATGVLFYEAAPGSKVVSSTLRENDVGAYYDSEAAANPTKPEVSFANDVLTNNRYEGLLFEQGKASVSNSIINGTGNIGIDLIQSAGQTLASASTANKTTIEGQSEEAIKVTSDKSPSDIPGTFKFLNGTLTGNGANLLNESAKFTVTF